MLDRLPRRAPVIAAAVAWAVAWAWLAWSPGIDAVAAIPNKPPVFRVVSVTPKAPTTKSMLVAKVRAIDPEGHRVRIRYQWRRNGIALKGRVYFRLNLARAGNGDRGDHITLKVIASDGRTKRVRFTRPITVVNSRPVAYPARVTATAGTAAHFTLRATDADAQRLTFSPIPPARGSLGSAWPVACVRETCRASVTYKPRAGVCNATDGFPFAASDGAKASAPVQVSIRIATPMRRTTLGLSPGSSVTGYQHSVRLFARLAQHGDGATITFWRRVYGGRWERMATVTPGVDGRVSFSQRMTVQTAFAVRSAGDNCFLPASSSVVGVKVRPRIIAGLAGFKRMSNGYHVYGWHVPTYIATVIPSHAGHTVVFRWQRKVAGTWRAYLTRKAPLDTHSRVTIYMVSGAVPGIPYRVRIEWPGGGGHAPAKAPWARFLVIR